MKKTPLTEEELNDLKVTLKPVLGIKPEQYIKGVYLFLILAAFFLVFLLPGILKNGTWYSFTSSPEGASVYADGIRLGATPGRYFVPRGERTITVKTPYTAEWSQKVKVKGRIFGTLFARRNRDMHIPLESAVNSATLKKAHAEAAAWFSTDEGFTAQPLPPVLTDLMHGIYRTQDGAKPSREEIRLLLASLLRSAAEANAYRQWQESWALYALKGSSLNPGTLLGAIPEALAFLEANPNLMTLLSEYHEIPELSLPMVKRLPLLSPFERGRAPASVKPVADLPLRLRPAGILNAPDGGRYELFAADREISKGLYSRFLAENPDWAPDRRSELTDARLADDNYLSNWEAGQDYSDSREPVDYVSQKAAEAFCAWMDETYFPGTDKTLRLPDEWEWQAVAQLNGMDSGSRPSQKNLGPLEAGSFHGGILNLYDMEGNLWEWCANGFGTNDPLLYNSLSAISAYSMPTVAVRGGSWANDPGKVTSETRASQPASWCTPYIGFRPVLLIKR